MSLMKCVDGVIVEMTPEEEAESLASQPGPLVIPGKTFKADIWRRATDAEADTIVYVLSQQTTRKQRLFNDATLIDHGDAQFTELKAGFAAAFGQERAEQLLAPSA